MSRLPSVLQSLTFPVIASPLFIISNPKLLIAQCKAGVVGSMPALNARPAEQLEEWLIEITEALAAHNREHPDQPAAPFAINQIVHKSNDRLEHDMALCVKYKVPIIITSLGAREDINAAAHSYGGIVLHDVINNKFAKKAIEKGADGLIAVAAGAGGHAGVKSPFALIQEIREWFDGPVALSGAIATGGAVLAAQAMGADFAYIGSAFIATDEARAADRLRAREPPLAGDVRQADQARPVRDGRVGDDAVAAREVREAREVQALPRDLVVRARDEERDRRPVDDAGAAARAVHERIRMIPQEQVDLPPQRAPPRIVRDDRARAARRAVRLLAVDVDQEHAHRHAAFDLLVGGRVCAEAVGDARDRVGRDVRVALVRVGEQLRERVVGDATRARVLRPRGVLLAEGHERQERVDVHQAVALPSNGTHAGRATRG